MTASFTLETDDGDTILVNSYGTDYPTSVFVEVRQPTTAGDTYLIAAIESLTAFQARAWAAALTAAADDIDPAGATPVPTVDTSLVVTREAAEAKARMILRKYGRHDPSTGPEDAP